MFLPHVTIGQFLIKNHNPQFTRKQAKQLRFHSAQSPQTYLQTVTTWSHPTASELHNKSNSTHCIPLQVTALSSTPHQVWLYLGPLSLWWIHQPCDDQKTARAKLTIQTGCEKRRSKPEVPCFLFALSALRHTLKPQRKKYPSAKQEGFANIIEQIQIRSCRSDDVGFQCSQVWRKVHSLYTNPTITSV